MVWQGVGRCFAAREFDEAKEDTNLYPRQTKFQIFGRREGKWTYGNESQTRIKRKQQPLPPTLRTPHPFQPHHLRMKLHSQTKKDKDEELLEPDAAHVDMDTVELLTHWGCGTRVTSANDLDNERDEVQGYEGDCQDGSGDGEDGVGREVEVYHAGEEHVGECVDP